METKVFDLRDEASQAFQELKKSEKKDLSKTIDKLKDFQIYLENLQHEILKKRFKDRFILQWIFLNKSFNDNKIQKYIIANICAASDSLKRIIFKAENEGINVVRNRMLLDFICDLKPFVNYFDEKQDYKWLVINTNSHLTNFYSDISENIFWNGEPSEHPEEKITLASCTTFMIRQSIEYKIKRILGIDYILINGKLDNRIIEKCFKAIDKNLKYYIIKDFDFDIVKIIYNWTHYFIHGGYRPEPWRTETAINYLSNLFYTGKTSKPSSFSVYAGIQVKGKDLDNLKITTEESIKSNIVGEINIKWLHAPEVAVV